MSILKTSVSSNILISNKIFVVNEIGSIEGGDKLIEKYRKLLKTKKLSKFKNLCLINTMEK